MSTNKIEEIDKHKKEVFEYLKSKFHLSNGDINIYLLATSKAFIDYLDYILEVSELEEKLLGQGNDTILRATNALGEFAGVASWSDVNKNKSWYKNYKEYTEREIKNSLDKAKESEKVIDFEDSEIDPHPKSMQCGLPFTAPYDGTYKIKTVDGTITVTKEDKHE
jgi:hypothetical protein